MAVVVKEGVGTPAMRVVAQNARRASSGNRLGFKVRGFGAKGWLLESRGCLLVICRRFFLFSWSWVAAFGDLPGPT